MKRTSLSLYVQSAADDTPGHAGIGIVVVGSYADEMSEYIGIASAEQALYQAVIQAISFATERDCTYLTICCDNELLLRRLKQRHCPELNINLSSLHKRAIQNARFHQVRYSHVASDTPELVRAKELALTAMREQNEPQPDSSSPSERHALQQSAGGVVYKRVGRQIKVCLIAKKDGCIWALPKGRLQPGESWEGTAMREVLEETGHLTTIAEYIDQIDYYFYWKNNQTLYYKLVAFFLMPVIKEDHRPPDGEADKIAWMNIGDAIHRLHYQSEKNILIQAQELLRTIY